MNQYSMRALRISHSPIAMEPILLPRRAAKTATSMTDEATSLALQASKSSVASTTRHENRLCYSTSSSHNDDDAFRISSGAMVARAAKDFVQDRLRKNLGIVPSLALGFPIAVVRTWRID